MANSRTWYSWVDYALPDCSSATLTAKSILWALPAAVTGNIAGGTLGPAGAVPAGAKWTLYGSSDSATAGLDATDRWKLTTAFDATKLVRAAAGVAHSWICLQSPTGLSGSGSSWYLTLDYSGASTDARYVLALSKVAPTGGSITARPTSTDETVFGGDAALSDNATWTNGRCHYTVDANGNFWFGASRNGNAVVSSVHAVQTLVNLLQGGDTWPVIVLTDATNTSTTTNALREAANQVYRGGATEGNPVVGIRTKAYNPSGPVVTSSRAVIASFNVTTGNSLVQQQAAASFIDSNYKAFPCTVCTTTAGVEDVKGDLPDCRAIFAVAAGTRVPAAGNIDKIAIGSTLIPLTAVPTL